MTQFVTLEVLMIDVTVKIPEDRVGEFYELVGRWLSGEQTGGTEASVAANWTNSEEDVAFARAIWGKFSPRAKALFTLLMAHPGQRITGEEIAKTLDIPNGMYGVAGVLAWPGRHSAAVGRVLPICWESGSYWLEQDVADLFRKAQE